MTTTKIAVSLPEELVAHARAVVQAGGAPSVSAYVADALEKKKESEDLRSLLDQMLAETGGPLTQEEIEAADREIGR